METLKHAFFEDPLYVYIALVVAELVLAAVWHETRRRFWLLSLLAPPVLAAGVWALERYVVTDREQIISATKEIARDLEKASLSAAEEYLDEDFGGHWASRKLALQAGKAVLARYRLTSIRLVNPTVKVDGSQAAMHTTTVIALNGPEAVGHHSLVWNVTWIKRPQGWRVLTVRDVRPGVELGQP